MTKLPPKTKLGTLIQIKGFDDSVLFQATYKGEGFLDSLFEELEGYLVKADEVDPHKVGYFFISFEVSVVK